MCNRLKRRQCYYYYYYYSCKCSYKYWSILTLTRSQGHAHTVTQRDAQEPQTRHESNLDGVGKLWKIAGQLGREKIEREIRITSMECILTTEIHQDSCRRQIQEEKKHRHLLSTSLSNWTRSTYFPVSDLWRKWTSVLLSSRFWINLVHSKILLSGAPHLPFDHIHQPKKHLWYNVDSLWRLDQRLWMVKKAMGKQSFFLLLPVIQW